MAKTLDEAGVKRLIQEIKGANKNLNAPIPISTENTTESKAQNAKNIADYVEKAKAAGIANVNGMAVTCIIDNDYSGVGYLYGDTTICGIKTNDALEAPSFFDVESGSYHENEVLVKGLSDQITSDMLVEGARNPIILTDDTTEVDEETYQKLLSDDVDVIFKTIDNYFLSLTYKEDNSDNLSLYFSTFSIVGGEISDMYPYCNIVTVSKSAGHTCEIDTVASDSFNTLLINSGYLNKSTLTPVLQEIDLTGTDAERKAKLDQFEADWKALTGASNLTGARFVGITSNEYIGIFTWSEPQVSFVAMATHVNSPATIYLDRYSGQLTEVPLFSHLEAVTIYTDNTPEHMQANLDNIAAYEANLQALGVDVTKGCTIPIVCSPSTYCGILFGRGDEYYEGVCNSHSTRVTLGVAINTDGSFYAATNINTISEYRTLTTLAKQIIPAINEVNSTSVTNRADLDRTMSQVASPDDRALPLLCGQPPILFGAGTPKEAIVPDNWNQYDPATGEGYNWNGTPSAIGQQYIDTTAASGGRYIAARNGEYDLKWINS